MKLATILSALLLAQVTYAGDPSTSTALKYPSANTGSTAVSARASEKPTKSRLLSHGASEPLQTDRELRFDYRPTSFVSDHGQYRPGHW
jgi:hypothetical protein